MSHSANNITEHRLHPKERAPRAPEWEIHVGMTGILFIVGPGDAAWFRVYREQSPRHIDIIHQAVARLNQTKREDFDAGPVEIRAALIAVGWESED